MTREQAIAELNVQHAAGDIDADTYAAYRAAIEYEHGEQMSAQDAPEVVA